MVRATITAASKKFNVTEGSQAEAVFNFSQALDNSAGVVVRLTGIGAVKGKDYSGFSYSINTGTVASPNWVSKGNVASNGYIDLPMNSTGIKLTTSVTADTIAGEQNESLVFSLAQTQNASKVLENSYYVTSTANIKEPTSSYFSKIINVTPNIDPASNAAPVIEGDYATATFQVGTATKPLSGPASVRVKVEGHGATLGEDTLAGSFEYKIDNGNWSPVTRSDGKIDLPNGTYQLQLRVATIDDLTTESPEPLQFSVAQVSGNLKDSYYVTARMELIDAEPNTTGLTALPNKPNQTLTGTASQDVFDMVDANSRPFLKTTIEYFNLFGGLQYSTHEITNGVAQPSTAASNPAYPPKVTTTREFDLISNFGEGDVIKLASNVNRYSFKSTTAEDLMGVALTGSPTQKQEALISWLNNNKGFYDGNFEPGHGGILKIDLFTTSAGVTHSYLLIDTNADGIYNTRHRGEPGVANTAGDGTSNSPDGQYDTLIKITGAQDIIDAMNGESFITE